MPKGQEKAPKKRKSNRRRVQMRLRGVSREGLSSGVLPEIRRNVERDARRFNVSYSFVVATILAVHYRIEDPEEDNPLNVRRRR